VGSSLSGVAMARAALCDVLPIQTFGLEPHATVVRISTEPEGCPGLGYRSPAARIWPTRSGERRFRHRRWSAQSPAPMSTGGSRPQAATDAGFGTLRARAPLRVCPTRVPTSGDGDQ